MAVPFIDLKRFEDGFLSRWAAKVACMSANAQFIGGDEVAQFECRAAEAAQVAHAVTCANGTDAIQLALRAVDVKLSDVVLVPDLTFWATFEAVVNVGAIPVTVDIDWADAGVDMEAFCDAIDKFKPKAAVVAHLYGWASAYLDDLRNLCRQRNVALVEDGAQCFGTQFHGESIFKNALVSTTSFYPAKVLGAAGDGGALFTNDPALADRVRQLGNHGRSTHYHHGAVGWNSRMDALQAAFLNISLDHLPQRLASRRRAVAFYDRVLPRLGIRQIKAPTAYVQNGYCNVCVVEDKQLKSALEAAFKEGGIGFGNIYPGAMSDQPGAAGYLRSHVGGHNARRLCSAVLNLPLFAGITDEELEEVARRIVSVTGVAVS